ncbi:MAG: hypothetical protein ACKPJD_06195 [Planctomycetaceae bacterium]
MLPADCWAAGGQALQFPQIRECGAGRAGVWLVLRRERSSTL